MRAQTNSVAFNTPLFPRRLLRNGQGEELRLESVIRFRRDLFGGQMVSGAGAKFNDPLVSVSQIK